MSTVDIDSIRQDLALLVGQGTELTPYDTTMLIKYIDRQRTTLKAELLAKMPKKTGNYEDWPEALQSAQEPEDGYNVALTEITKIVNEL